MEAVEDDVEHMALKQLPKKTLRIVNSSVLDSFTHLTSNVEAQRVSWGITLLKYLFSKQHEIQNEEICTELSYALNRLIRGVGSSHMNVRRGFFSTLVGVLSTFPNVTVEDVLSRVKKCLHVGKGISKGEEGEISTGQILVCGALIRSELLLNSTPEEQKEVLSMMVAAGKRKSYLPLVVSSFIIDFMNKIDDSYFENVLWPILKPELKKSWLEHSLETLHILLVAHRLFPAVVRRKFIKRTLGTSTILSEDSIEPCSQLLLNFPTSVSHQHPVYEEFCKQLAVSELLIPFWKTGIDPQMKTWNRNREFLVLEMLQLIFKYLDDKSKIPKLMSCNFLLNIFKIFEGKDHKDEVSRKANQVFMQMVSVLQDEVVTDKTRLSVIKRLLFYPGDFMFEKRTGIRVIQLLTSQLKVGGVQELAGMYRDVLTGHKPRVKGTAGETGVWYSTQRLYAAELLTKLLGFQALHKELEWKVEQLKLLISVGLFASPRNENGEVTVIPALAEGVKGCFFRALDQRLPRLDMLRSFLSMIVHHVHTLLFTGKEPARLRQALSEKSEAAWHKMVEVVQNLEADQKVSTVPVFHTLFLHMGLQLFQDAKLAGESLEELHNCYTRVKSNKKKQPADAEEPHWVEVTVDLFLSLLSHNSHLLRSVVGCVFPHLCPHLTPHSIHQILQVLNPHAKRNPLSSDEPGEDSSSSEDESESPSGDEEDKEDSESDMSDVDDQDDNEPLNFQLKEAVRKALGEAAETDVESVDMDEMDEDEGKQLDTALSEAFKLLKKSRSDSGKKNKKQSKDDKALTHFRVRVMDLLEVYLNSQPSLALCLDMMLPLFELLEFSIKDAHQKPLENRVRSCMKKLSLVKQFSTMEGVDQKLLCEILKHLLERGDRTAAVYHDMSAEVTMCSAFLVRCSQQLQQGDSSLAIDIYKQALFTFFKKRDSLLTMPMFRSVLQMSWDGAWGICPLLVDFAFDIEVRPYRRREALDLLIAFFRNNRLLIDSAATNSATLIALEEKLSENSVRVLECFADSNQGGVKVKFLQDLLCVLRVVYHVHSQGKLASGMNWLALKEAMLHYRNSANFGQEVKAAFNKLARTLQISLCKKKEGKKVKEVPEPTKNKLENDSGDESVMEDKEEEENSSAESEDETTNDESKRKKKKKKQRRSSKSKAGLRKQTQQYRMDALSEGLDSGVSFTQSGLSDLKGSDDDESVSDDKKVKKRRKSGVNRLLNGHSKTEVNNKRKQVEDTEQVRKKHKVVT